MLRAMFSRGSRASPTSSLGLPKLSESNWPRDTPPRRVENACGTPASPFAE